MKTDNRTSRRSLSDLDVPEERKGPTPEELAYKPKVEGRNVPRYTFSVFFLFLILAFAGGGVYYYRVNILPEKNYQRANHFFREGKYEKALSLYRQVLKTRPERKDTLFQIGQSLEKLGKSEEAIEAYRKHVTNQPRDERALERLVALYKKNKDAHNVAIFLKKLIKQSPNDMKRVFELGQIYATLSDDKQAIQYFQRVLKKEDEDAELLLATAKSLYSFGEYRDALSAYEKADVLLSGDKRGLRGAIASRAMLGLPRTEKQRVIPHKQLGEIRLATLYSEQEVRLFPQLHKHKLQFDGRPYTAHVHPFGKKHLLILITDEKGFVVQIESDSPEFLTDEGLGLVNFDHSKRADSFDTHERGLYLFKTGGLAFFRLPKASRVQVFDDKRLTTEQINFSR